LQRLVRPKNVVKIYPFDDKKAEPQKQNLEFQKERTTKYYYASEDIFFAFFVFFHPCSGASLLDPASAINTFGLFVEEVLRCVKLYKYLRSFTKLYEALRSFTKLYEALRSFTNYLVSIVIVVLPKFRTSYKYELQEKFQFHQKYSMDRE
jgi:hypothetical protein